MSSNKYFIGRKLGMTQIIDEFGVVFPVTVVKAYDTSVIGFRTIEKDGYSSLVVGYNECEKSDLNKPKAGQFSKKCFKYIKEFRTDDLEGYELDQPLDLDAFELGKSFHLRSKTIGRGFTGAIKAWNHQRGPETHGSKNHRLLGSIGQATTPGRVKKGKKMHTRYGNDYVTIKNLTLVKRDGSLLFFKGAVPGKSNNVFGCLGG